MSYSFSTGQVASGASLSIHTGSSTYTAIGQIQEITQSGKVVKTVDATNLQSTVEEVLPTLPNSGELKVRAIRVPADAGQAAVLTQFNLGASQAPIAFKLQLPPDAAAGQTTAGDLAAFSGYVTECDDFGTISAEKLVNFEFTVKVVTLYTVTAGS
jgi:hypothetical protein